MIFFPPVSLFFPPLGHAIIVLSQTMYWGENMARGKSNHTMFHKIMGNLEKNAGHRGHNIIFFSPITLIVTLKSAQKSNLGKIYDIFSPSVFIFSPLGHAIIVLLSQTVYWGENIARWKSNHIFPAEHNLFL
jgi:hypothetical protein